MNKRDRHSYCKHCIRTALMKEEGMEENKERKSKGIPLNDKQLAEYNKTWEDIDKVSASLKSKGKRK